MQLPQNNATGLIRQLARVASESKDKSLFSLLLQLEQQQIYGATLDSDVRLVNSKTSLAFKQRQSLFVSHPSYIE
jgi:hypothetical protein